MPLMSARLAGAWSGCWPWPTIAAARQRWPHRLPTLLEAGTLPELEPLQAHLGPDPQSLPQLATLECEVAGPAQIPQSRRGALGRVRVHRRVLQSTPAAFGAGLPVAGRVRGRSGRRSSVNAVTAPILALGALQGRDSPTVGGVRAVRRPSRPHSGPLRAFQTPRGTPGYPLKHPSKSAPSAVGPRVGHDIMAHVDQTRALNRPPATSVHHPGQIDTDPRSDNSALPPRPLDLQGPPGSPFPLEKSQTSAVTCPPKRDNSRREPGGASRLQRSARPPDRAHHSTGPHRPHPLRNGAQWS